MEDKIESEKDRSVEVRGVKDKVNHNVYKQVDDLESLKSKENELRRRLE